MARQGGSYRSEDIGHVVKLEETSPPAAAEEKPVATAADDIPKKKSPLWPLGGSKRKE